MSNLAMNLADDLDAELIGKLLKFKTPEPVSELDRAADAHRRMLATYEQRKADARKEGKATVAGLEIDKKDLKARFEEDMASIAEKIAEARSKAEIEAATADKLAAASRAALAAIAD